MMNVVTNYLSRLYFGSFVRFITPSDSQTFPTSVFLSTVTAAISACPRQVKSGTIPEDINKLLQAQKVLPADVPRDCFLTLITELVWRKVIM